MAVYLCGTDAGVLKNTTLGKKGDRSHMEEIAENGSPTERQTRSLRQASLRYFMQQGSIPAAWLVATCKSPLSPLQLTRMGRRRVLRPPRGGRTSRPPLSHTARGDLFIGTGRRVEWRRPEQPQGGPAALEDGKDDHPESVLEVGRLREFIEMDRRGSFHLQRSLLQKWMPYQT